MSSGFFGFIGKYKAPFVLALSSGYFAFDTYHMQNRKDSEICVKIRGKPVLGVLGDVPCVSPSLQELIDEVKPTLNLPLNKKRVLNYYVTPFPKPKINGFFSSFSHIDIFLPDYFNIFSSEQLSAQAIRNLVELMGENFDIMETEDWLTPDGKSFLNSFLLSKRAKKYLITQASYANLNPEYHLKYFVFAFIVLASIITMSIIEERVKGSIGVKILFGLLMFIPLVLIKNLISCHANLICESNGLAQAISRNMLSYKQLTKNQDGTILDEEMLLGALEYYSKLLQRNKAAARMFVSGFNISAMLDEDGERLNPFQLELPKREVISQLEKALSLLQNKNSPSSPNVTQN